MQFNNKEFNNSICKFSSTKINFKKSQNFSPLIFWTLSGIPEINAIAEIDQKKGKERNLIKEPIIKDIIKDSCSRKAYLRKSKYEKLYYRDIINQTINKRNANPLRLIYKWSYADDKKSFTLIDGNYPLVYCKYLYKYHINIQKQY